MSLYAVVGSGAIGRGTARALAERGEEVVLLSRSGRGGDLEGVTALSVDATDGAALARATSGAKAIVNALNPAKYHRWPRDWPPMAAALLEATEANQSGLVTVSNLYLYGLVDSPMTERTPVRPNGEKGRIRAGMWDDALAAHDAGRIRATELRASDYFGPGVTAGTSALNQFVIKPAAGGRSTVRIPFGVPDSPHSWTYVDDVARFAALLATDDRSWGRAWHVPSAPPLTMTEVASQAAELSGHRPPKVKRLPRAALLAARLSPVVRSLDETAHQFERPFVLDASDAEETFGFAPTPWEEALERTVRTLSGSDAAANG